MNPLSTDCAMGPRKGTSLRDVKSKNPKYDIVTKVEKVS
jgi:hypothetical protein